MEPVRASVGWRIWRRAAPRESALSAARSSGSGGVNAIDNGVIDAVVGEEHAPARRATVTAARHGRLVRSFPVDSALFRCIGSALNGA